HQDAHRCWRRGGRRGGWSRRGRGRRHPGPGGGHGRGYGLWPGGHGGGRGDRALRRRRGGRGGGPRPRQPCGDGRRRRSGSAGRGDPRRRLLRLAGGAPVGEARRGGQSRNAIGGAARSRRAGLATAWHGPATGGFAMTPLYVSSDRATVRKDGGRLRGERDGETLQTVPLGWVDEAVVFDSVQVTTQALVALLRQGARLAILSHGGELLGRVEPPLGRNGELRVLQCRR